MLKPVNPRHHIIVYMPLDLLMFLTKRKALNLWLTMILRYIHLEKVTAPQLIRMLRYSSKFYEEIIWLTCSFTTYDELQKCKKLLALDYEWAQIIRNIHGNKNFNSIGCHIHDISNSKSHI